MTTVSDESSKLVPPGPDPDAALTAPDTLAGEVVHGTADAQTSAVSDDAEQTADTDSAQADSTGLSVEDDASEPAAEDELSDGAPVDEPDDADTSENDVLPDADATSGDATSGDAEADVDDESDSADPDLPEDTDAGDDAEVIASDADDPVVAAATETQLDPADDTWWRTAVFYQVYPRSFSDLDGDGIGDLAGVIDKLGYLELLGVDAIWLNPIMRSPMADHGYDVSDPRDIDPLFGDLATFDELVAEAHDRDIRVTMDLVPNHSSDQHPWFTEALAGEPGGPERARYIFRDGRGHDGDEPPNNWPSVFGGPAWTRITEADGRPGQWYLHIFAPEQPDLNWDNPEVFDDLEQTLRFWLDRGVDGFRIDVAHGMAKPDGLPDMDIESVGLLQNDDDDLRFNNPGVHDIHRRIRTVLNDYPGATTIGEIWVDDNTRFAEYLRPDELHLGFNFRLAKADFDPDSIRSAIENSIAAVQSVGGVPTWTLSNHDVEREVTRYAQLVADRRAPDALPAPTPAGAPATDLPTDTPDAPQVDDVDAATESESPADVADDESSTAAEDGGLAAIVDDTGHDDTDDSPDADSPDAAEPRTEVEGDTELVDDYFGTAATDPASLDDHDVPLSLSDELAASEVHTAAPDLTDSDIERGILRARAMMMVELALPGAVFIYNGAELGLPNVDDLPDDVLQDPVWERSGHTERGRDGCRVPLPWEGAEPPFGFSVGTETWLPMPASWSRFTVESQLEDIGSTLSLYRQAIELRYERAEFAGDEVEWYGAPEGCLAFRRSTGHLICAINASEVPVPLPPGEILLVSSPLVDGYLAPDSAAWLV